MPKIVNDLDLSGNTILNADSVEITGTPTAATDAATVEYVDESVDSLPVKNSVRLATTASLSATYSNGISGVGATLTATANGALSVDSIATLTGNSILVKNQAASLQNGIYVVTVVGSGGAPFVLTRRTDFDSSTDIGNAEFVSVKDGSVNAHKIFVLATPDAPATVGTDAITFVEISGSGGGGHTIQDEGIALTNRTNLNFVGANVTVTDDSGNNATLVTISGGGGGSLQDAYDAGNEIITTPGSPVQILQTGSTPFFDPGLATIITEGARLNFVGAVATELVVSAINVDVAWTYVSANQIDLGAGVNLLTQGHQIPSVNSIPQPTCLVFIKTSDVAADRSFYVITAVSNGAGTNSVATLFNLAGPTNITGTAGICTTGNQTKAGGGDPHYHLLIAPNNIGTGTAAFFHILNDGGNLDTIQTIQNTAGGPSSNTALSSSLLHIFNTDNTGNSDVPLVSLLQQGNHGEIKFSGRASDPTGLGAGDEGTLWYNLPASEFKYWDGAASQTFGGSGGSLDTAYDFGGAGAGRTIIVDSGAVSLNAVAETTVLAARDTSTATDRAMLSNNGSLILNPSGTTAPIRLGVIAGTPSGGATGSDFWYDSTADRYQGNIIGTGTVSFLTNDISAFYTIDTNGDYTTVYAAITDLNTKGIRDFTLWIQGNTTETQTLITLTANFVIRIVIAAGVTWDSDDLTIRTTNGTARLNISVEGEVPLLNSSVSHRSQWSMSKTTGTGADGVISADGGANDDSSVTIKNLRVVNTSTLAMADGVFVVANKILENFEWVCDNTVANNQIEGAVWIYNGEFVGTGTDSQVCRLTQGEIKNVILSGTFVTTQVIEIDGPETLLDNITVSSANAITISSISYAVRMENFLSLNSLNNVLGGGQFSYFGNIRMPESTLSVNDSTVVGGTIDIISVTGGSSRFIGTTIGATSLLNFVGVEGQSFTDCVFVSGVTLDSASHHNRFSNCTSLADITVAGDFNQFHGGRVGQLAGGGTETITISGTANSTIVLGIHTDAAIADSGTATQLLANMVY